MNDLERFRVAGHSAPTVLEASLPEEIFLPIQKVVDTKLNDKTVGYLFRNVACNIGAEDIILKKGLLRNYQYCSHDYWIDYEQSAKTNPLRWFLPSGPLLLEICSHANQKTTLGAEVRKNLRSTFEKMPFLGTTIEDQDKTAKITHNQTIDLVVKQPREINLYLPSTNATINRYLHALIGKRHYFAAQILEPYGSPVTLTVIDGPQRSALVFHLQSSLDICPLASTSPNYQRQATGVTIAQNILKNKRYEVRDE